MKSRPNVLTASRVGWFRVLALLVTGLVMVTVGASTASATPSRARSFCVPFVATGAGEAITPTETRADISVLATQSPRVMRSSRLTRRTGPWLGSMGRSCSRRSGAPQP